MSVRTIIRTEPYLLLLLGKKVTHFDLLIILPKSYKELIDYPCSLAQSTQPAFKSLEKGWIDPLSSQAPYHPEIGRGIVKAVKKCDITVLDNYLWEMMCEMVGAIPKRQRGDAYGFGDTDNHPELVTNLFTEEELQSAATHSKDIENVFGVVDAILTRFGVQAFDKSTDDLIIRYSEDMLPDPSEWCSVKTRRKKLELESIRSTFNEKQDALLKAGVTKTDAILLQEENKVQRVIQEEELEAICSKYQDDTKPLRSALIYEIRYRKFTAKNIKEGNPLFKQLHLTVDEQKENL